MAGIPFFVGFFAKFFVLQALWSAGYAALAVLAVLMSLVGAFYYLRIVKVMFFDDSTDNVQIESSSAVRVFLSVNVFSLAVLGMFPGFLMQVCVVVVQASL
jgi:NADH-quinone oxidoreductase subunit N